jgi:hypothetical protein
MKHGQPSPREIAFPAVKDSQLPEVRPRPRWIKFAIGGTVLALLAAGTFRLPTADRYRANQIQAWSQAIALESAVHNFHTEYGVLPAVGNHVQTDGPDGVRFLNILLGLEGDSTLKQNLRNIKFLSVREAKDRRNGLQYGEKENRVEGLYDVWGYPFIVEINVRNEPKLRFNHGSRIVELPGRLVAVYSPGKDGKPGTSDDVTTW